ncbi:unnamed protein product [Haemonchus placei]|uniref:Secretory carrier membrane protein n=1 Tax=Haemonchus placei TaxID=6290 RepID=A0A0N4VW46_HAEPC|nr:unnamed protein product [Haemonchus placei]
MPPRGEKAMSPEEAKQLQELYQEYDFGMDVGPEGPIPPQSFPINSKSSAPAFQSATDQVPRYAPPQVPQPPPRQAMREVPLTKELHDDGDRNVHRIQIQQLPIPQKVGFQHLNDSVSAKVLFAYNFLFRSLSAPSGGHKLWKLFKKSFIMTTNLNFLLSKTFEDDL